MTSQKRLNANSKSTSESSSGTPLTARTRTQALHFALASVLSVALLGCTGADPTGGSGESQVPSSVAAAAATSPTLPPWKEFVKALTEREQKLAMAAGGAIFLFFLVGVGVGKSIRRTGPSSDFRHVT